MGVYFEAIVALCGTPCIGIVIGRNGWQANAITAEENEWKRLDELDEDMKTLMKTRGGVD